MYTPTPAESEDYDWAFKLVKVSSRISTNHISDSSVTIESINNLPKSYWKNNNKKNQQEISENSFSVFPIPSISESKFLFSLSEDSQVSIQVTNLIGQAVASPVLNEHMNAGRYQVNYAVNELIHGVYFCTLTCKTATGKEYNKTQKLVVVK